MKSKRTAKSSQFSSASGTCFYDCVTTLFLAVYDVLYACVDDTIYDFDDLVHFSTMTIDSTTCTNMGLESDVSGTIYSVDVSNDGQTLCMQYK